MPQKSTSTPDVRRQIVAKAIVDPAFRARLFKNPESVFLKPATKSDLAAIERLRKFLPALEDLVHSLAGEVLCGGGGGCGGLA
jgi:hypothetical protein